MVLKKQFPVIIHTSIHLLTGIQIQGHEGAVASPSYNRVHPGQVSNLLHS